MLDDDLKLQNEGDRLFNEGKFGEAECSYREISSPTVRFWSLGLMHFSLGEDWIASRNFINCSEHASGGIGKIRYAVGKAQYGVGDYKSAKANLETVLGTTIGLSEDVKKDTERMLRGMSFGVLNKFFKKVKRFVLENPYYASLAVTCGSLLAYAYKYLPDDVILHLNDNILASPLLLTLLSLSFFNANSKRFLRRKRKGIELDTLLKYGTRKKIKLTDILEDTGREFVNCLKSSLQPLFVYSMGTILHSHEAGLYLGIADFVGWYGWKKHKEVKKANKQLITLERIANYSVPIGAGIWFSLGWLNNLVMKNSEFPLLSTAYLSHLTLRALTEKNLFERDKNKGDYLMNRINKISLLNGLAVASLFQGLQIHQFERMMDANNFNLKEILNNYGPSNFISLLALSAFFTKHSLVSIVNQEFKSQERFSLMNLIKKPILHYPLTLSIVGGCLGCAYEVSANRGETPLGRIAFEFLYYGSLTNLAATFSGWALRKLEAMPDYFDCVRNKMSGNLKAAISSFRRIVSRPYSLREKKAKHLELSGLLIEDGDVEGAFVELKKAESIEIKAPGFFDSVVNIQKITNLSDKEDLKSKRKLAVLCSGIGRVQTAKKQWQECLSLEDDLMHNCLFAEFLSRHRLEGADEQWRKVIALMSKQPFEIEGLDSTHVVKHVKGRLVEYVLKFGDSPSLKSELDITSRLANAVRNHPDFLAADPLTVFKDKDDWVLATKYQKHENIDVKDVNLLKKIVEYMHFIYSLNIPFNKNDELKSTGERVELFVKRHEDPKFKEYLADFITGLIEVQGDGVLIVNTDSSPNNWGLVGDLVFRCDIEPKGGCHPYLELSHLLCLTDTGIEQKERVKDHYVGGFGRRIRRTIEGKNNFSLYLCLRAIQIIPRCFSATVKVDPRELPLALNSLEQGLICLDKSDPTQASGRALDYTKKLKEKFNVN